MTDSPDVSTPSSPRPGLPRPPSTSSQLSVSRSDASDTPRAQHEIRDINLVLQRRGTDPVTQPDTVRLLYFLRHHNERRFDCMFEFSLSLSEILAEMQVQLSNAGGLVRSSKGAKGGGDG